MLGHNFLLLGLLGAPGALAKCYDPSPVFPLPAYELGDLDPIFDKIEHSLKRAFAAHDAFDKTSFSVEVTSSRKTLWSSHHDARTQSDRGVRQVDGNSLYRIASITKAFTTLALLQQHAAGNLSVDSTIDEYIHELKEPQKGTIPWKDITLRSLASQLSGIPREFAQSDLITELDDPTKIGLPPASRKHLLKCDAYSRNYKQPCGRKDLLDALREKPPLFAPNQKSTYSNVGFELLGLAIENVTGVPYSDHIKAAIFEPLRMSNTTLETPQESQSVIPQGDNFWGVEEGIQRPTGGIYSSTSDMSKYLRYVLTHYNGLTHSLNWFHPASYSGSINSFYGMPWEIFRTDRILQHTKRPVTFVTKSGGLPGYFSIIIMLPEYDIGITVLVAGSSEALATIRELVTVPLVQGVNAFAAKRADELYGGTYVASESSHLNSSVILKAEPVSGLTILRFISNGTDILGSAIPSFAEPDVLIAPWHAQLLPTLLYRKEKEQQGELWRSLIVLKRPKGDATGMIWDDFCTTDFDPATYAGIPLNEFVFWSDGEGHVVELELSAFKVKLKRETDSVRANMLKVQG